MKKNIKNKKNKKQVIINADDFGLSGPVNEGIIQAHKAGMLKSVSLLTNSKGLKDALEKYSDNPDLGLGLHLTLVFGKPVSPPEKVSSLLFKNDEFAIGFDNFVPKYLLGQIKLDEIEYEWERQRDAVSDIKIDHIDSHQHLHLLPGLFDLTIKLAKKWKVKYVRVPYENFEICIRGHDNLGCSVLNIFSWGKKRRLSAAKLKTTDNFFGSSFTGALTEDVMQILFLEIPEGVTEIMCHPGKKDAKLRKRYGWTSKWEEELKGLTNSEIQNLAEENGIIFTNYRALVKKSV